MKCLFCIFVFLMLASIGTAIVWVLRDGGEDEEEGGG